MIPIRLRNFLSSISKPPPPQHSYQNEFTPPQHSYQNEFTPPQHSYQNEFPPPQHSYQNEFPPPQFLPYIWYVDPEETTNFK